VYGVIRRLWRDQGKESEMSKKSGNKTKTSPKPPMENKGPKKK
jgi:hypothetical protein